MIKSHRKEISEFDILETKRKTFSLAQFIVRVYQSPGWMALVALFIRLVVAMSLLGDQFLPGQDNFSFGWEIGRVARSLALGEGFSSPLPSLSPTGPTAWMTPVYVYIVAIVFKIFGVYTVESAVTLLALNALFSALTCLTVFFIADKSFGRVIALRAGWMWAMFPYAIEFGASRIWGDCLNALLFSALFLAALWLEDTKSPKATKAWIGFGLLAGLTTLACPPVLLVVLLWIARIWRRNWRRGTSTGWPAALAMLMMLLVLSPWFARNYRIFDRFIPFRDNFWLEMRVGNTGDTSDIIAKWAHPSTNKAEMEEYQRLGELNYMASKRRQTLDFIHAHPGAFVSLTVRRFFCVWTGFWSIRLFYVEPLSTLYTIMNTILTVFMLIGLFKAWRFDKTVAIPYLLTLLGFPLVYYLTHPHAEYRHPIDTIIVILVVYGAKGFFARIRAAAFNAKGLRKKSFSIQYGER
ncbi:MAG: glycosyltransferase family 39 protein [Blastocatellia bacterium]|nr:glycosyltransferase family 39 protein [Blastocatellia bacterium]